MLLYRFCATGALLIATSFGAFAQTSESPYLGTPAVIPGIIQAEDFDNGGEGVAYHSSLSTNTGNYRLTTLPIYLSSDTNGGYQIQMTTGDWAKYTVTTISPGLYNLRLRLMIPIASNAPDWWAFAATVHVEIDGLDQTGPLTIAGIPNSATGQPFWQTIEAEQLVFKATNQVVRIVVDRCDGGTRVPTPTVVINYIQFSPAGPAMPVQFLAGALTAGFADGTGSAAQFSTNITGMDVDIAGNVYLADAGNLRIRKISPDGVVTTLAGTGTAGTNDGPGISAQFMLLAGPGNTLAVDEGETCYVLDQSWASGYPGQISLNVVRSISPQGTVSTRFQKTDHFIAGSMALKSSGQIDVGLNWPIDAVLGPVVQTAYEVFEFELDGSTDVLATGNAAADSSSPVVVKDLATGYSTNLYCLYSSGQVPTWSKVVQFPSLTNMIVLFDLNPETLPPGFIPQGFFRGFTAGRTGKFFFIWADMSDMLPVGTLTGHEVKTLGADGFLETLMVGRGLSPRIAVDAQTNVYCVQSNRVTKLVNYPGLTLVARSDGGGLVSIDPTGPYFTNTAVTVSETNWPGLTFMGWTGDAIGVSPTLQFNMTNHIRLKAVFGAPINISVTNATVQRTPDLPMYPYGTQVQLVVHPDPGYAFQGLSAGLIFTTNPVTGYIDSYTNWIGFSETNVVSVTNEVNLQAIVTAIPRYTVSAAALGGFGGSVQLNPSQGQYFAGTTVVLTAVPLPGYDFQTWLDNVQTNPRTLVVTSNTMLFAAFAPQSGPARILTSPIDTNVVVGAAVLLNVAAQGAPPLQIQWQFNGTNLAGATNALLILAHAQLTDAGTYTVTVTNGGGSASAGAKLTVHAATGIRFQGLAWGAGGQLAFTVEGPVGANLRVESSSDLQNWSTATSLQNTYGVVQFSLSGDATATTKFYRIVQAMTP